MVKILAKNSEHFLAEFNSSCLLKLKKLEFIENIKQKFEMTKIQSLTSQQRLHQLVKKQLGGSLLTAKKPDFIVDQVNLSGQQPQQEALSQDANTEQSAESLLQRAQRRLDVKLERQQYNLERVLLLAQEFCSDQIAVNEIDPDWFYQFSEMVQDISTASMQKLWAKILAGEIMVPGSFSLKTLLVLKQMNFKDAQSLQAAAALACRNKTGEPGHIYFGYVQRGSFWRWLQGKNRGMLNLSQYGLTYPQILNLIDLGLLHQSEIESGELIKGKNFQWQYHQQTFEGLVRHSGIVLQYYKFTTTGAELLPLLGSNPNPNYSQALQILLNEVISVPPTV